MHLKILKLLFLEITRIHYFLQILFFSIIPYQQIKLVIKHTLLWCVEVAAQNLLLSWQKRYEKFILGQIFKDSAKIGTVSIPSLRKFRSSTTYRKKQRKKVTVGYFL